MTRTIAPISDSLELTGGHPLRSALVDEPDGVVRVVSMAQSVGQSLTDQVDLPKIRFGGDVAKYQLLPGDVLFRARGITTQAIYIESVTQPCIFAAPLIRLRVTNKTKMDSWYLHWVLNSPEIQRTINAQARGSMIRMVSLESLRNLQIPVPPLAVQQEIAEVARLLRQEQTLSEALMARNRTYAEKILWAKAQEVR